jgi:hypothetical protein
MMQRNLRTACLVAALLFSGAAIASAQGGSTDARENGMGSERVGSAGGITNGGAMHQGMQQETTGVNTQRSEQDSPNGSPNTPPTAKQGPVGDPSRDSDAPK